VDNYLQNRSVVKVNWNFTIQNVPGSVCTVAGFRHLVNRVQWKSETQLVY
jgi:hypothetical protein